MNYAVLADIGKKYGESFYLLDTGQFERNFIELRTAFRKIYPNTQIAYSYKTNYTPRLCKIVNRLGGYAEIVSDMEYELTKRIGVQPEKVIWNGPYKDPAAVRELLLAGGTVNLDSVRELDVVGPIAAEYPDKTLSIGVRCNFPVGDGVLSRFGVDIHSEDFGRVLSFTAAHGNIRFAGLHCHFANRCLETWANRAENMVEIITERLKKVPDRVDLGGGLFGRMEKSLKAQFSSYVPTFDEYANAAAAVFAKCFPNQTPTLFIEPGSALAGDVMKFAAKVVGLKTIRGKSIAALLGSVYNINPTLNGKNLPIHVYHKDARSAKTYKNLDFGGYTCIESDYLYRGFTGKLGEGDYVVFDNAGSYSVVLKPPFILPNFAVVGYDGESGKTELVKRKENFDDLFHTFVF